jgi:hypothetical protein
MLGECAANLACAEDDNLHGSLSSGLVSS